MVYLQNVLSMILRILFILFALSTSYAESTSLTDINDLKTYEEVTSKVRCICLPSLPIKSCSYNNCSISAYIKMFMENRIKAKENAETILYKMEHGFGEEILDDPIVKNFVRDGNQQVVESLVYGFGPKILAEPDATFIDLTIILVFIISFSSIFYYLKRRKKSDKKNSNSSANVSQIANKYLSELNEEQR